MKGPQKYVMYVYFSCSIDLLGVTQWAEENTFGTFLRTLEIIASFGTLTL